MKHVAQSNFRISFLLKLKTKSFDLHHFECTMSFLSCFHIFQLWAKPQFPSSIKSAAQMKEQAPQLKMFINMQQSTAGRANANANTTWAFFPNTGAETTLSLIKPTRQTLCCSIAIKLSLKCELTRAGGPRLRNINSVLPQSRYERRRDLFTHGLTLVCVWFCFFFLCSPPTPFLYLRWGSKCSLIASSYFCCWLPLWYLMWIMGVSCRGVSTL